MKSELYSEFTRCFPACPCSPKPGFMSPVCNQRCQWLPKWRFRLQSCPWSRTSLLHTRDVPTTGSVGLALFQSSQPWREPRGCSSPEVQSGAVEVVRRRAKGISMACGEPRGIGSSRPAACTELPALTNLALFVLGKGQLLFLVPACLNYPGFTDLFSMTHAGKMTISFSPIPTSAVCFPLFAVPRFGKEFRNAEHSWTSNLGWPPIPSGIYLATLVGKELRGNRRSSSLPRAYF